MVINVYMQQRSVSLAWKKKKRKSILARGKNKRKKKQPCSEILKIVMPVGASLPSFTLISFNSMLHTYVYTHAYSHVQNSIQVIIF